MLGTWKSTPSATESAVTEALSCGYRGIDCANDYDNEPEVGRAIRKFLDGGGKREELFVQVTTHDLFDLSYSLLLLLCFLSLLLKLL